jgi:uncharacterized cupin superfamily protein
MPKIDLNQVPVFVGTTYPEEHAGPCKERQTLRLGLAAGLTQFGVVRQTLAPGSWSSQRHWHSHEDEFVFVLEGEVVLATDAGEEVMRAGDAAGFKAGVQDGHHLQNRSDAPATLLVVGSRNDEDHGEYPDIDMKFLSGRYSGGGGFRHKDGSTFE